MTAPHSLDTPQKEIQISQGMKLEVGTNLENLRDEASDPDIWSDLGSQEIDCVCPTILTSG